jgi:hypothetical protein
MSGEIGLPQIIMVIFKQNDFSGGLDTQLDAAKSPDNAYPLLVNARVRRNVISPTNRHQKLLLPAGNFQGLYAAGQYIILFSSGVAYFADITVTPPVFQPVANWTTMDADVSRIYAEIVPATANFFNRDGTPDETTNTFNGTIAAFSHALFVFDGINQPQAILPDGTARVLKTYADWSKDDPEYVPIGSLPAVAGNKLFVVDPDRTRIYHSVTGRCSDFVVNLTNDGEKGGDAATVSQTVSYNAITALKALSSSQLLVGTLYGTFVLDFDYDRAQFGEPYLRPVFLFASGPLNEISIVDILQDTAFITQTGIHGFNAVAQAKRESNNFPLGAKIRGLLQNPQSDTCAGFHDDYAYFAVNTIYGYGAIVFDTTTQGFQSLDLSFGRVKQFATTKVSGYERMFYITHNNEIFEAFAEEEKNVARVYLGDWTPNEASQTALVELVNAVFANVRGSGIAKLSLFADNVEHEVISVQCTNADITTTFPVPIPYVKKNQVFSPAWALSNKSRGWRSGLLIEWDFDGDLTDVALEGNIDLGPTVVDVAQDSPTQSDIFAFIGSSGYTNELNTGGSFPAENYIEVAVEKGEKYVYVANGNGVLAIGNKQIASGIFTATADAVQIHGTGAKTFTLRKASAYISVLDSIYAMSRVDAILHGGNFAYPDGALLDVTAARIPVKYPIHAVAGEVDIATDDGTAFFNKMGVPNYFTRSFEYVDFFFFNSSLVYAPDGTSSTSIQAAEVKIWAENSTKRFKILVIPDAPYTTATGLYPGRTDLRYFADYGISAIISTSGKLMERYDVNGFPYLVCGAGGQDLATVPDNTEDLVQFRNNTDHGILTIEADELTCRLAFKNTAGDVLDSHDIYA